MEEMSYQGEDTDAMDSIHCAKSQKGEKNQNSIFLTIP